MIKEPPPSSDPTHESLLLVPAPTLISDLFLAINLHPPSGSNLFPAWHRPYVLLLETSITGLAKKLALKYPPAFRKQYVAAAEQVGACRCLQ